MSGLGHHQTFYDSYTNHGNHASSGGIINTHQTYYQFSHPSTDERMTTVLSALQSLPFQEKHRDLQMRRMEGLGQWLLNMPKFGEWREGSLQQNILWCHGGPGVGKSFLASVVVDHLYDRIKLGGGRLLYFYFDYKRQSEQTAFSILVTLLRQLLSTHSTFPKAASDLYKRIEKGQGLPAFKDLMMVFRNICASSFEELFLVFDALDECDEQAHREPILDLLEFMSGSNVRVLITSRPYPPDINEAFENYPQVVIEAADADIRAFLLEKISKSRRKSSRFIDEALREEIIRLITAKSQGMFLLPALQIENILGQTNPRQVREALRALPSALVDHLHSTMERIKSQDSQGQPRTGLAMAILMWLSHVKRPLTVNELQHAIATIPGVAQLVELTHPSFFTECCLGLVTIDTATSTVRLVHLSVNEYLQDHAKFLFPSAHGELAITCLTYLSLNELYGVKLSTPNDRRELSSKFPFLNYAVSHWGVHAAICFNAEVERATSEFIDNRPRLELWNQLYDRATVVRHMSALHVSAIFGIEKLAQDAVKDNRSPNPLDSLNRSPLMLAAAYGQKGLLNFLLSTNGIKANLMDSEGRTALGFAVRRAQIDIVQMLLSCPNIDINIGNPFVEACQLAERAQAYTQIVKLLLSRRDLDVNSPRGDMAAWEWLGMACDWELLRMLLSRQDFDPSAYFTRPQVEGKSSIIWKYILHSEFLEERQTLSVMPTIHALDVDHRFRLPEFAFLLLSWPFLHIAFTDGVQREGKPGDYYYQYGMAFLSENENGTIRTKFRMSLEELGFSFDSRDSHGRTYLHFVAQSGDLKEDDLHFLLKRGADVSATDNYGSTPLHYAAQEGRSDHVAILLDAGAQSLINATNKFGSSPLHDAVRQEHVDTYRLLLQRGANPNLRSVTGTPLHIGAQDMDEKRLSVILSGGGDPHLLDCFGRSSFDWVAMNKPLAEKMGTTMLRYKPTPPHVARRHLLKSIQERINLMVSVNSKMRDELMYRLGKQLLYLGDEESARTIFETFITTKMKSDAIEFDDYCGQCSTNIGHLYYCKTCPFVAHCKKCLKDRKDDKTPWCKGHDFLKVPGDIWKDLPIGVVNKQGQSFEEWMKGLEKKYCSELTIHGVHQEMRKPQGRHGISALVGLFRRFS